MDHEHIPVRGEMDPTTAAAWGEVYQQVPDGFWEAVCAWGSEDPQLNSPSVHPPSPSIPAARAAGHPRRGSCSITALAALRALIHDDVRDERGDVPG